MNTKDLVPVAMRSWTAMELKPALPGVWTGGGGDGLILLMVIFPGNPGDPIHSTISLEHTQTHSSGGGSLWTGAQEEGSLLHLTGASWCVPPASVGGAWKPLTSNRWTTVCPAS